MRKSGVPSNRVLAEQLYELFNARDLDALLERAAPDIEWDWSRSRGPDAGVYHGVAATGRFLRTNWEHWEEIEMTPEEIVEAGDDVVVFVRVRLRGRNGIEIEARGPHVQTWRGDRLCATGSIRSATRRSLRLDSPRGQRRRNAVARRPLVSARTATRGMAGG